MPTTSTCSTPAARPACPRASCGARATLPLRWAVARLADAHRRGASTRRGRSACGPSSHRRSCTAPRTGSRCACGSSAAPCLLRRPRAPRSDRRLGAVERERVECMLIVGDAFARPLVDELGRRATTCRSRGPVGRRDRCRRRTKRELLEQLPRPDDRRWARSSEAGAQASTSSTGSDAATGRSRPPGDHVLRRDLTAGCSRRDDEEGWLAKRGRLPLGYLRDADKTARTFPVIDGVRYAVPGDRARCGRRAARAARADAVTINSAARRSSPRRWSTPSRLIPASTTAWSPGARAIAGAARSWPSSAPATGSRSRRGGAARRRRPPHRPLQAARSASSSSTRSSARRPARPTTAGRDRSPPARREHDAAARRAARPVSTARSSRTIRHSLGRVGTAPRSADRRCPHRPVGTGTRCRKATRSARRCARCSTPSPHATTS